MKIKSHLIYYILLVGILSFGLILILRLSPNKELQMLILIGMSISYVLLGVVHHLINHDLVAKIVIEYVLVALLGVAAAFFIFKGGFGI